MQARKQGLGPQALMGQLQQMANSNPQIKEFMGMVKDKSPQQIEQMAREKFKASGRDYDGYVKQLKSRLGF